MAQANPNAAVRDRLIPTTHIHVDDVRAVPVEAACLEAQNEGFVVVAVEDDVANDGCFIVLQGAPSNTQVLH